MSSSDSSAYDALLDPKFLKTRLVHVSIYVLAFELLKSAVIERIKDFFIDGFDQHGVRISDRYSDSLAKTGKKHLTDQSLAWLKDMEAITDEDIQKFHEVRTYRNELVHNLPEMISKLDVLREATLLREAGGLLRKIEVWWIQNVEIPTNPDYDGSEIKDEDIIPGNIMFLQMIADVGLQEGEDAEKYLRELQKRRGQKSSKDR